MNLAAFDLNLLLVFDALLTERHVTRAGQRVGLSQPAVSAALGRLRHAFGDELFVRNGGEMVPTPRAMALAEPVREALIRVEIALGSTHRFDPAKARRSVTMMGSDYVGFVVVPPLMERLQRLAPGLDLRVVSILPSEIPAQLADGRIDFAIDIQRDYPPEVRFRMLIPERYLCILRQDHPALGPDGLTLDLYCRLSHALRATEGPLQSMVDAALAAVNRRRRVVLSLPHFVAVAEVVAGSDLVGILPERLAHRLAPRFAIRLFEPPVELPQVPVMLFWHQRQDADACHLWLREQFAALAPEL